MTGLEKEIVILSAVRTPFGKFCGALKDLTATELGVIAGRAAIERAGARAEEIDHVIFGNVQQTSAHAIYLARHIWPSGWCAGVRACFDRESDLRVRFPIHRERGTLASIGRGELHSRRWNGEHEPGPSRDSRRALGNSTGRREPGGFSLVGLDRYLLQFQYG